MDFKALAQKFLDAIEDISILEVRTYTGNLTGAFLTGKKINWDAFTPDANADVKLVAVTHIDADFDIVNFRAQSTADLTEDLRQLHETAVRTSVEARTSFVKMVLAAIPK